MPPERMPTGDSLATRTISGFPLSIGTGLAMETLFAPRQQPYDPSRKVPDQVNLTEYQECWINLTTLFRNMIGAVNKEVFLTSSEGEFKDTLLMEMEVIDSLFQNEGGAQCKPRYYFCTYDTLTKRTPQEIKFREDKTDAQKAVTFKMMRVLERLMKETEAAQRLDSGIKPPRRENALIVTHIAYDLVSYPAFNKLTLLESHTGRIKNRNQWYTKYHTVGTEDLSHMPFLRKLLLVFGDRVLIAPSEFKLRSQLLEIAHKRQWTNLTSEDKVMLDLSLEIKEPFVLKLLKSL